MFPRERCCSRQSSCGVASEADGCNETGICYIVRSIGMIMENAMTRATSEALTPTEAAVVSSVAVRDVNRVVDEKILPEGLYKVSRDRSRRFSADACAFISFYFKSASQLTSEERMRTIATASQRLGKEPTGDLEREWIIRQDFLSIDLAPFLRSARQRLARLSVARALVIEDPDILGGTPVIKDTRIPVYDVAASVSAGLPAERILAAYPGLTTEAIELAALYAEANPQRGRPRSLPSPPAGAVIVSSRRKPRRKLAS
jgi:uncharacterized protein (DUF433 family)